MDWVSLGAGWSGRTMAASDIMICKRHGIEHLVAGDNGKQRACRVYGLITSRCREDIREYTEKGLQS